MPTPPISLASMPPHILRDIANYSDEREIWMLMRACRSVRHEAEAALVPHLKEKNVTLQPDLYSDVYDMMTRTGPDLIDEQDERRKALGRQNELFAAHLEAYPPSRLHLRKLTLDVSILSDKRIVWPHVKPFAAQLEHLELHLHDSKVFTRSGRRADELSETTFRFDPTTIRQWPDARDIVFVGPSFRNVTSLVIATPGCRVNELASISLQVPNIRKVTLIVTGTRQPKSGNQYVTLGPVIPVLDHLERVTVKGSTVALASLGQLRIDLHHDRLCRMRFLSIMINTRPEERVRDSDLLEIHSAIDGVEPLLGLAIYGPIAMTFFEALPNYYRWIAGTEIFLQTLVLEGVQGLGASKPVYPLLAKPKLPKPSLPYLRRITYIIPLSAHPRANPDQQLSGSELYDPAALDSLFQQYRTLELVEWISHHPEIYSIDPFDHTLSPSKRRVVHTVHRPDDLLL